MIIAEKPIYSDGLFLFSYGCKETRQMVEKQHLDVNEVAKYFGIKVSTVYRLAQVGKLPGFKVGGQWRFNRHVLESWMLDRTRERMPRNVRRK